MARRYDFTLPVRVPFMYIGFLKEKIEESGLEWPPRLIEKIDRAEDAWSGFDVTQEDLDSMSDECWAFVEREFASSFPKKPPEQTQTP